MKRSFYLTALAIGCGLLSSLYAQTLVTHDFNNGELVPYETRKADQRARVYVTNGAVETHWEQSKYNGTNSGRKAQFMPIGDPRFTQHIWMGLSLKIHDDYMRDNPNTNAGLMQIWGYNGSSGAANHMCMLKFDGRNGGALVWQHRYNSVANKTHYLIQDNFPRNEFVDIIVHVQLRNQNDGIVQIWVNGELAVDRTGQKIGWGDQDETGMINGTYCFGTSLGQYNYNENAGTDDAYDGNNIRFDGHLAGETRTVTYDNVALYNGVDGFDLVDPSDGENTNTESTESDFTPDPDKIYFLNVPHHNMRLAATGESEDVYTVSSNETGEDARWQFIENSSGLYHIRRADGGAVPGLRTDGSEDADMQETSSSGDFTQFRIDQAISDDTYYLTAINGPTGYKRLQIDGDLNVKMVGDDRNGTWESFSITEVTEETLSNPDVLLAKEKQVAIFPNPMATSATLLGASNSNLTIYNFYGTTVHTQAITSETENINLSALPTGIYYAEVKVADKVNIIKLIKK